MRPLDPNALISLGLSISILFVIWKAIDASVAKRRANLDLIKQAIERGQQLDEKTVRLLLGRAAPRDQRKDLKLHGTIWVALGIGLAMFSLVAFGTTNRIMTGLGVLLVFVGIGLFAASRVIDAPVVSEK
ncbi:MAG TPA: DUF6249 domain-containing protein [Steroidobacteraceae bacterium]|nr:DUF6249 domain-containing protein [Steroidobacteraceae bacterium]